MFLRKYQVFLSMDIHNSAVGFTRIQTLTPEFLVNALRLEQFSIFLKLYLVGQCTPGSNPVS